VSCARMLAALKTPDLTAMQRLVYVVIVGWADGDHCRTTVQAIADQLSHGTQRATVYRAVEAIEQMGLIRSEKVAHGVFRYQLLNVAVLASEQRTQPRKSAAKHAESGRLPPLSVSPRYIVDDKAEPTAKNGGGQPPTVLPGYNGALYHHDTANGGSPPNTVSPGYKPADASDCITTIQETAELSQNVYHQDTNADCIPTIQKSAEVSHSLYPQDTIPCARADSDSLSFLPKEESKKERKNGHPSDDSSAFSRRLERETVVNAWNEMASRIDLPKARLPIGEDRVRKLNARLHEHGLEGVLQAIREIAASSLCRGEKSGWSGASFDFLVQQKSCRSALEGAYRDRERKPRLDPAQADDATALVLHFRRKLAEREPENLAIAGEERG
jgi:hypothetical protein